MAGDVGGFIVDFDEPRNKDGIDFEITNLAFQIVRFQFGRVRPEEDGVSGNCLETVICDCRRKIVLEICDEIPDSRSCRSLEPDDASDQNSRDSSN